LCQLYKFISMIWLNFSVHLIGQVPHNRVRIQMHRTFSSIQSKLSDKLMLLFTATSPPANALCYFQYTDDGRILLWALAFQSRIWVRAYLCKPVRLKWWIVHFTRLYRLEGTHNMRNGWENGDWGSYQIVQRRHFRGVSSQWAVGKFGLVGENSTKTCVWSSSLGLIPANCMRAKLT
jgi:hypothetical protein